MSIIRLFLLLVDAAGHIARDARRAPSDPVEIGYQHHNSMAAIPWHQLPHQPRFRVRSASARDTGLAPAEARRTAGGAKRILCWDSSPAATLNINIGSGASPKHPSAKEPGKSVKKPWCRLILLLAGVGAWPQEPAGGLAADQALARLMAGNQRYVRHKEQHPDQSLARRKELTAGQHPFAVILGCADSRVAPELLFDQGLGDLFDTRVAGNIVDDAVLGSIEYAVEHLGTKLVMVLGNEKCGAVFRRSRRRNRRGTY